MIYSFLVGELSGHYIVRPHLTLAHDSLDSIIHTLRRIFVFFQQPFDKAAHSCSCALFLLPVYCLVFAKQICQFFRDSNKLIMLVKVLDCLRLRQSILESKFVRCQSEFFTLGGSSGNVFRQLE